MKPKQLAAQFLCATLLMASAGCAGDSSSSTSSSTSSSSNTSSTSGERTTFIVGFDAEFPPYGYKDENGDYTGFDLEMAQAVADLEGWTLVKQPIDWDAKDMELSSGTIDCIWNGFTMTGREDQYTFTTPYIDNSQVFVVRADSDINSPEDLAGKNVGVQKESSALAALEEEENAALTESFAELRQYGDYNTAFMDLEAGGIDAIALDLGVAQYNLANRPDLFKKLDQTLSTEQYAVGFLLGNTDLRDEVQEDIYILYQNGTVAELAEKYQDYNLADSLIIDQYVE